MNDGRMMDDGRWTMDDGRWTMDDGRLTDYTIHSLEAFHVQAYRCSVHQRLLTEHRAYEKRLDASLHETAGSEILGVNLCVGICQSLT